MQVTTVADARNARSASTDAAAPACTLRCNLMDIAYRRRVAASVARIPRGAPVQPTVQTLLDRSELALTLLTPAGDLPAGALDAPVLWAHTSDLVDPTPFLDAGHMLLTTGTQFEAGGAGAGAVDAGGTGGIGQADFAEAYVRHLREAGIAALGF